MGKLFCCAVETSIFNFLFPSCVVCNITNKTYINTKPEPFLAVARGWVGWEIQHKLVQRLSVLHPNKQTEFFRQGYITENGDAGSRSAFQVSTGGL